MMNSQPPAPVAPGSQTTEELKSNDAQTTGDPSAENPFSINTNVLKSQINSNICIKHFPEPIIYISDEPMCKKCVPEYLEKMKQKKNENRKDQSSGEDQQTDKLRELFGAPKENHYTLEKNLINNCLIKLEDFKGDFRYINEELEERVAESN